MSEPRKKSTKKKSAQKEAAGKTKTDRKSGRIGGTIEKNSGRLGGTIEKNSGRLGGTTKKKKSPRCHRCDRAIRVPAGWSPGAAVRRHYWSKHRDVMQKTEAAR